MKSGSVIVDMAASALGGNCELSVAGETVTSPNGVTIIAPENLPASMPAGSSAFYARNISALLLGMVKDGNLNLDFEDEVTKATVITHGGAVVSEPVKQAARTGPRGRSRRSRVSPELLSALTVFVLAILVGFAVISKVPATLHTPLMSGANSIHGIVLVGSMFIAIEATDLASQILSLVAVAFATMNVVGGYVVTDRMLQMFKKKPVAAQAGRRAGGGLSDGLQHHLRHRPPGLAGRRRLLRHRPHADELAGHGPQRQPAVGRRHGGRHRGHGHPAVRATDRRGRPQRHRLGDHRRRRPRRRRWRPVHAPGP